MQQRQLSQSTSEQRLSSETTPVRRTRARRVQLLAGGAAAALLAVLATGCPEPADLANPNDPGYVAPLGTSGSAGGAGGPDPCEVECVKTIFQTAPTQCKLCHGVAPASLGGLDLVSPNFTARLKDVPSKHIEISPPAAPGDCPTGDKLIDTANPANSWLLKKIRGEQKSCGAQMPSPPLGANDMACVEKYISCVAGGKSLTGGGGSGAGGTGGSAAGTGGSAAGTGGSAAGTGGSAAGTGGSAAGRGGGGGTGGN